MLQCVKSGILPDTSFEYVFCRCLQDAPFLVSHVRDCNNHQIKTWINRIMGGVLELE